MEKHALGILSLATVFNYTKPIQESGNQGKLEGIRSKLLYHLIMESQNLGGEVLNQFWERLGTCNERLKENVESLKEQNFVSAERSYTLLFQGLNPEDINFEPVLKMSAEFFTHLCVAIMNPGGKKSGSGTEFSVTDFVCEETERLIEEADEEGFGNRKHTILKTLAFKRDGESCLLTFREFKPFNESGVLPICAHIIPNSVHGKPDTLKCIAMFAGDAARDDVMQYLNTIGNVMNMQQDAHTDYDNLMWGIEAQEEGGKVDYRFRLIGTSCVPGFIALREGDLIRFGEGRDGKKLGKGPIARLCNLRLAVARVLKMSGAADIIFEWKDQADDDGLSRLFIASEEFCDMVDAKLLLSGRVVAV